MRAVIFDLDGTLVHSAPDIHAAVNRTLHDLGADGLSLAEVTAFIGNGVPTLIARVVAARGLSQDPHHVEMRYLAHYEENSATLTILYPGVRDALRQLCLAGFALGVCTNKPEASARQVLAAFDLAGFIDAVVGGDTLAVRKPDPAPLLATQTKLGRAKAIFVGDSEVDAETAEAARMPFVLFAEGYRKVPVSSLPHQAILHDFNNLPDVLQKMIE